MQLIYLPQPTVHTWERAAQESKRKWQFPHCIGFVDDRHIVMKNVQNASSAFFNYKGTFSTVLMATVDANYRITSIDVGSVLGDALHCETLPIPPPAECCGFTDLLPHVFVGDEAVPLLENLMRSYPRCRVTCNMDNKGSPSSRICFRNHATKFRIFRKPFEIKLEIIDSIVKAGCVLHNYSPAHTTSCEACDDNREELPADQLCRLCCTRTLQDPDV
ncbi:hypothetical protein PR048_010964 [Dryococelus australis]|uniref:Uncharacterized protein n=1 Tax=Dryococelus australis TaxID=614101 RepID=A0ABQ9HLI3_9NEOP|nr:hypothetical protein PR048_010964 [Dryococelus australis]